MNAWDRVNKIEAARELGDLEAASELARQTRGLKSGLTTDEITAERVAAYEDAKTWNFLAEGRS